MSRNRSNGGAFKWLKATQSHRRNSFYRCQKYGTFNQRIKENLAKVKIDE
jgi:hypothetical protein